jgi:hypothetical protein
LPDGAPSPTALGADLYGAIPCDSVPSGGFAAVDAQPGVRSLIGCPVAAVVTGGSAYQPFQNGVMLWLEPTGRIYALANTGEYIDFVDTWNAAVDPERGGETPPAGLLEPIRGFGKVWRDNPAVRNRLGWATADESGATVALLAYERGAMVSLAGTGQVWVLSLTGSYQTYSGAY